MKLKGKIIGGIFGTILTSNIIGIALGASIGHLLFDFKEENNEKEIDIIDETVSLVIADTFKSIIKICFDLINLKNKFTVTEIDSIKNFLKNEFLLEKNEILQINEIIKNFARFPDKINFDTTIQTINQKCNSKEKIKIIELLFVIAISDTLINEQENEYINKVSSKINIGPEDFNTIKDKFIKKEIEYYKILGLLPDAKTNEIKTAYRKLINTYHPDKNINKNYDNEKFQEIVNAYSQLKKIKKLK